MVVGEGPGHAEWKVVALLAARFQMVDGKSQGKCFDRVCNP